MLSVWPDLAVIWLFALALPTITSTEKFVQGGSAFLFNDRRVVSTVLIELASLAAASAYLKRRGLLQAVPSFRPSWIGTGLGLGLLLCSWGMYYLCALTLLLATRNPHLFGGFHIVHQASLAGVLAIGIVNPIFEELVVVAFVIRVFERHGAPIAILASAGLRLSYHLYQGPLALASTLPMGLLFAAYYWKKRDLWPLIVAHAFMDVMPSLLAR
jgi:membrane protease YdiL (CAAX protease family)